MPGPLQPSLGDHLFSAEPPAESSVPSVEPHVASPPKLPSRVRTKTKHPLRLFAEVVGGGLAGLALAFLLLQYVIGIDLLGSPSTLPEKARAARPAPGRILSGGQRNKPAEEDKSQAGANDARQEQSVAGLPETPPATPPSIESVLPSPETIESGDVAPPASSPGVVVTPPETPLSTLPAKFVPPFTDKPAPDAPILTLAKFAVPTAEERTRVAKEIEAVFGKLAAAQTAEQKKALAKKLIDAVPGTSDWAIRFVLLQNAMQMYGMSADVSSAFAVLETMAAQYDLDPLKVKAAKLPEFARSATTDAELKKMAEHAAALLKELTSKDQYDLALSFVEGVRDLPPALQMRLLAARPEDVRTTLRKHKLQWEKFTAAKQRLAASPDDADANLIAGLWYCANKGDFEHGLPLLAKGSDPALKSAALGDLAGPTTGAEQVKAGDAWYVLSKGESTESIRSRAGHWYRKALPTTAGFERARLAARLSEITPPRRATIPRNAVEFGGHTYSIIQKELPWHYARAVCERLGGHLVRIESAEEQQFVEDQMVRDAYKEEWYWTDGSDDSVEGEWRYSDGRKLPYSHWWPGQPDSGSGAENQLALRRHDGLWNDAMPGSRFRVICEWEIPLGEARTAGLVIDDLETRLGEIADELLTGSGAIEGESNVKVPRNAIRFGGHRYGVFLEKQTWHSAGRECKKFGGHLVRLESAEEEKLVRNLIEKTAEEWFWIDLSNEHNPQEWRFSNGEQTSYLNWAAAQPEIPYWCATYGVLYKKGGWDDAYGGQRCPYICEWDE